MSLDEMDVDDKGIKNKLDTGKRNQKRNATINEMNGMEWKSEWKKTSHQCSRFFVNHIKRISICELIKKN